MSGPRVFLYAWKSSHAPSRQETHHFLLRTPRLAAMLRERGVWRVAGAGVRGNERGGGALASACGKREAVATRVRSTARVSLLTYTSAGCVYRSEPRQLRLSCWLIICGLREVVTRPKLTGCPDSVPAPSPQAVQRRHYFCSMRSSLLPVRSRLCSRSSLCLPVLRRRLRADLSSSIGRELTTPCCRSRPSLRSRLAKVGEEEARESTALEQALDIGSCVLLLSAATGLPRRTRRSSRGLRCLPELASGQPPHPGQ